MYLKVKIETEEKAAKLPNDTEMRLGSSNRERWIVQYDNCTMMCDGAEQVVLTKCFLENNDIYAYIEVGESVNVSEKIH